MYPYTARGFGRLGRLIYLVYLLSIYRQLYKVNYRAGVAAAELCAAGNCRALHI